MKDYRASIEKLCKDAAEAALIRDLATNGAKREVFNRLNQHLNRLADEVYLRTRGVIDAVEEVASLVQQG
jgi:hypothetical protein